MLVGDGMTIGTQLFHIIIATVRSAWFKHVNTIERRGMHMHVTVIVPVILTSHTHVHSDFSFIPCMLQHNNYYDTHDNYIRTHATIIHAKDFHDCCGASMGKNRQANFAAGLKLFIRPLGIKLWLMLL